jgi:hypothetical protein
MSVGSRIETKEANETIVMAATCQDGARGW